MLLWFPRLCEEYEKIAEKALTSPANTEHLMELKVRIWCFLFACPFICYFMCEDSSEIILVDQDNLCFILEQFSNDCWK